MTTELTLTVDDDAPALAGAIVYHAKTVCETTDHLWQVLGDVSIPTDGLTDNRQQHKVTFDTESMARVYTYRTIYDPAQSEVVDRLENRLTLLKQLGLSKMPTQKPRPSPKRNSARTNTLSTGSTSSPRTPATRSRDGRRRVSLSV